MAFVGPLWNNNDAAHYLRHYLWQRTQGIPWHLRQLPVPIQAVHVEQIAEDLRTGWYNRAFALREELRDMQLGINGPYQHNFDANALTRANWQLQQAITMAAYTHTLTQRHFAAAFIQNMRAQRNAFGLQFYPGI